MVGLLVLTVAGAIVRVAGLSDYYLSPDEATIMAIARAGSLADVWRASLIQAHPPLHFFLMSFWPSPGNSIMWLKASSLVPGLLFIPTCYFLGRKALGGAAGWAMALFAAFGLAPMVLAQAIRPYALLALFLVFGLWFWLDFVERPRLRSVAAYGLCLLGALCLHYSGGLMAASTGLAGAALFLVRRRPMKDLLVFCLAHLPAAATGIALYFLHLSRIPELTSSWISGYLDVGFPKTIANLAFNLYAVPSYFFQARLAPFALALLAVGTWGIYRRGKLSVALLIACSLSVALTLNLAHLYPLYGLRHTFWLFPVVALWAAAGIEGISDLLRRGPVASVMTSLRRHAWVPVALIAGLIVPLYAHRGYFRITHPTLAAEFPLRNDLMVGVLAWFEANTTPDDLIVTSVQTADLLRFKAEPGADRRIDDSVSALRVVGRDFYYLPSVWLFIDRNQIGDIIRRGLRLHPTPSGASVIVLSIGYGNQNVVYSLGNLFRGKVVTSKRTFADYLLIQRLPADQVRAALIEPGPVSPP